MKRILLVLPLAAAAVHAAELPDVTSRGGLRIGSVLIPWNNAAAVALKGADATQPGEKACAFNATYEMTNLGGAATKAPFANRLRVDGATVVATSTGLSLAAHETKSLTTSPYLPIGQHTLELSLDDENSVAESNENNNRFRVLYELKAPCGAAAPAPSPGRR
jgi:hypothetical protein